MQGWHTKSISNQKKKFLGKRTLRKNVRFDVVLGQ